MKITINIECTPDEARQFLGLPNLQPVHDAVMARLERQITEAVDAFSPQQLLQSWLTPEMMEPFAALFRRAAASSKSGSGTSQP